ncbi:hypothetical protein U1Q18_040778 [Sarracenia purpurea var. burkii]
MAGLLSVLKPRFRVWSVSILPFVEDEDQGIGLPCVEGLVTVVLLFLPPKDYLGGKLQLFVLADPGPSDTLRSKRGFPVDGTVGPSHATQGGDLNSDNMESVRAYQAGRNGVSLVETHEELSATAPLPTTQAQVGAAVPATWASVVAAHGNPMLKDLRSRLNHRTSSASTLEYIEPSAPGLVDIEDILFRPWFGFPFVSLPIYGGRFWLTDCCWIRVTASAVFLSFVFT